MAGSSIQRAASGPRRAYSLIASQRNLSSNCDLRRRHDCCGRLAATRTRMRGRTIDFNDIRDRAIQVGSGQLIGGAYQHSGRLISQLQRRHCSSLRVPSQQVDCIAYRA